MFIVENKFRIMLNQWYQQCGMILTFCYTILPADSCSLLSVAGTAPVPSMNCIVPHISGSFIY
jgi:hypothetical protein